MLRTEIIDDSAESRGRFGGRRVFDESGRHVGNFIKGGHGNIVFRPEEVVLNSGHLHSLSALADSYENA